MKNAPVGAAARTFPVLCVVSSDEAKSSPPEPVLTRRELWQYTHLPAAKRLDWFSGRLALKRAVASYHDGVIPFSEIEVISELFSSPRVFLRTRDQWCKGTERGLSCSISHCEGNAVAAVSDKEREGLVGVDIERTRVFKDETLRAFLTPREYRFVIHSGDLLATALWSLKEAYLKARGVGLLVHPKRIEIHRERGHLVVTEDGQVTNARVRWNILSDRYVVSTALTPL